MPNMNIQAGYWYPLGSEPPGPCAQYIFHTLRDDAEFNKQIVPHKLTNSWKTPHLLVTLKHKDSFGKSENLSKMFFGDILVFDHDYENK